MEYILPSAKFVVFEGAGHSDMFAMPEFKEKFAATVEAHLQALEPVQ
jgi:hypothetical protein